MIRIISILFLLYCLTPAVAQQSIQGIVIDHNENPLGFAHATNLSLNLGQVSNLSGKFKLLARKGDSIKFSFVGYIPETLIVESIHLTNYLKVKLTEDSLFLPSITIYSDPYFKVPFRYQGESMEIGIAKSERDPIGPGSIGPGEIGGVGLTLYGPITFFSKDAKEQRKYDDAMEETSDTQFYSRYIAIDSVKEKLCEVYQINDATYDRIIVSAHDRYPQIQTMKQPDQIWSWLLVYFYEILN